MSNNNIDELKQLKQKELDNFSDEYILIQKLRGCSPIEYRFTIDNDFKARKEKISLNSKEIIEFKEAYLDNKLKSNLLKLLKSKELQNQSSCYVNMCDGGSNSISFKFNENVFCIIDINCYEEDSFCEEYYELNDLIEVIENYIENSTGEVYF